MSKTLYVTDLDGTLLNKQDRIHPESIRIINHLIEQGMAFTYATARSLSSASIVTQGLSTNIPVIVYNGAFMINPATREILSKESFCPEEMRWVTDILSQLDISPLVYSFVEGVEKVSWIVSRENEGIRDIWIIGRGTDGFAPSRPQRNYTRAICFILLVSGNSRI